jgi:hypothetical protein
MAHGWLDFFAARSEVHGRSDSSEIETIPAADVAIEHVAEVERHADSHLPTAPSVTHR